MFVHVYCCGLTLERSGLECVLYLSVQEITSFSRRGCLGSLGIVGNWKSRWTCMCFQEDMVTPEIETKHTPSNSNGAHLSICVPLLSISFHYSFFSPHFSALPSLHGSFSSLHSVDQWTCEWGGERQDTIS